MAELAAALATILAVVGGLPQLHRVAVGRDGRGVSVGACAIGVANEALWIAYALHQGLWGAVPEAVLMVATNVGLVVWLRRAGAGGWRPAVGAAALWFAVFVAVAVTFGAVAVGVLLGVAYAVQVAPAVWTAWRTHCPSGVAGATWAAMLVESVLWGVYGLHHGDPATSVLAITGLAASSALLLRKAVTHGRVAPAALTFAGTRP